MPSETRQCQNCKQNFTIQPEDFDFYKKIDVPSPTFCPQCRLIRRLSWRNERTLHRRVCAKCGKSILSIFAPETQMTIYCGACWWSDQWDAMDYGVDFDPSKPFLLQLKGLLGRVPIMNTYTIYTTLVNSEYVNMSAWSKNCYLTTYSDRNENCAYGSFIVDSKDCVDNLVLKKCEFMYESVNCLECYQTFYSVDCEGCHNVSFSKNCIGCSDCFGCANLKNKKYHIFNEPYSKEEYERKIKEFDTSTVAGRDEILKKAQSFWSKFPQRYMHGRQNTDVSGEYIMNSKNVHDSYTVLTSEDARYCAFVEKIRDSYDCTNYFMESELMYDSIQSGGPGQRIAFSWWVIDSNRDVQYGMFNIGSHDTFGCVGIKKKEYCILNKQYTKEEYFKLRAQIIEQMNSSPYKDAQGNVYKYGEFFPTELSPFGYNETTAQEFFPLSKLEAQAKKFNWIEPAERAYSAETLKDAITCAHAGSCAHQCTKAFKLIPYEIQFYKQFNIPTPNLCHNCRHYRRLELRNHMQLFKRGCQCEGATGKDYGNVASHFHGSGKCPNQFQTPYAPERPEIVYCEQCYNAEVV